MATWVAPESVGGWLLAAAASLAALLVLHRRDWRRFWLGLEDPRAMGLVRIVFALFAICNINGLWEHFELLFCDEGLFPADVARRVLARRQFAGFGDGLSPTEPWGFFDGAAVLRFLEGPRYSLLYFWDSPTAMWIHLGAFWVAAVAFMVGVRTRLAGVAMWLLMNSLLHRTTLQWEGTDVVFRVFATYLMLCRCGHAYSVDNWLRCRRLRRVGRLSERGGPGAGAGVAPSEAHPEGLEAIYRRIPVWPRRLMMLQLAALYFTTGALKNGSVWMQGDAIYYALNLDHFSRVPLQPVTALLGTNVLRAMSWFVRFGEMGFALVFVGVVLRQPKREGIVPPPRVARAVVWAALLVTSLGLVVAAWPARMAPPSAGIWIGLMGAGLVVALLWRFAGREWIGRWICGRRIWLTWAVTTMGGIYLVMNIGQFQTVMLTLSLVYLRGEEVARGLAWCRRGPPPVPAQDESLPHLRRDDRVLPAWALWLVWAAGCSAVVVYVYGGPSRWIVAAVVAFVVGVIWARTAKSTRHRGVVSKPWAYGLWGRLVVSAGLAWHIAAVGIWLMPARDSLAAVRGPARALVRRWLVTTQTDQGWGMFAPNPPRSNDFLQVLVTDELGEVWDLRLDLDAPQRRTTPFVWNDRARKMHRVLVAGRGWGKTYRKWYARYHCRQWAMAHDGHVPRSVQLVRRWYRIPSPEQTRAKGWYDPVELFERAGKSKVFHTERCATAVLGQPTPAMRRRHGLPEGEFRPWIQQKRPRWEARASRRD